MNKLSKTRRMLLPAMLLLITLTLIFIFVNSALPPAASEQQSSQVEGFITQIIPSDTTVGKFIVENLRKIAHFTEYGLLGIEISLLNIIYSPKSKRMKYSLLSVLLSLVIGFLDESIQILSGRGPSITDVWIDIGGFVTYSIFTYAIVFLAARIYRFVVKMKDGRKDSING